MKIFQITDFHNEKTENKLLDSDFFLKIKEKENPEVLILSGDIDRYFNIPDILKKASYYFPYTIHINGNHEFHYGEFLEASEYIKNKTKFLSNVFHLNRDTIKINNHIFLGCTLWTNLNNENPEDIKRLISKTNDFKNINYNGKNFNYKYWINEFNKDYNFLKKNLIGKNNNNKYIITHHSPTIEGALYFGQKTKDTYGFGSDLKEFILKTQPKFWFFGHTHSPYNKKLGNTQLINNYTNY